MGGFGAGLQIMGQGLSQTADRLMDMKMQQDQDAVEERRHQDRLKIEADAAAFYQKLQDKEDKRAEERLGFDREEMGKKRKEWEAELSDLATKSEAEAKFREETGQSFEAWSLLSEVDKFKAQQEAQGAAAAASRMNRDLARFNLDQAKQLAPFEVDAAKAGAARAGSEAGSAKAEESRAWDELKEWQQTRPQRVTTGLQSIVERQTALDKARIELRLMQGDEKDVGRKKRLGELQEQLTTVQTAARNLIEQRMSSRNEMGEPNALMEQVLAPSENALILRQEELVVELMKEMRGTTPGG